MKTAIILGTGPSLTPEVLSAAREGQQRGLWQVFGMNHVWRDFPTLDGFIACNPEYYETQWERGLKELRCDKWSWDKKTADRYSLKFIAGKWADGFSRDPNFIHYGHSSGFQLPQIAYHLGYRRLLLCGYDMKYAPNYDGKNHRIGSSPRHYFGEYKEPQLNHWPSVKVKDGVHIELIEQFEKVKRINTDVEILNCSIGSAMTCFPIVPLTEILNGRHNLRSSEVQPGLGRRSARNTLRLGIKNRSDKTAAAVDTDADRQVQH
jgi:hypothetical protein